MRRTRVLMIPIIRGLKFLLAAELQKYGRLQENEIFLGSGSARRSADVYEIQGSSPTGTILFIHGMSVLGNRDPRLINVCRAIATCGFRVIAPYYKEIQQLKILKKSITDIAGSIEVAAADPRLCGRGSGGKVGIFSPSFSAGMCLAAAAMPGIADRVSAICTVGTMGSVDTTADFLLGQHDIDDFGTMIVMYNFLRYSTGRKPALEKALLTAALDNGHRRIVPELPGVMKKMRPADRKLFEILRRNPVERLRHWKIVKNLKGISRHTLDQFVTIDRVAGIKAAVSLIHGIDDNVIPPEESKLVFQRLKEHGCPVKLTLTPLISHGDSQISIKMIPDILRLASGLDYFFRNV